MTDKYPNTLLAFRWWRHHVHSKFENEIWLPRHKCPLGCDHGGVITKFSITIRNWTFLCQSR